MNWIQRRAAQRSLAGLLIDEAADDVERTKYPVVYTPRGSDQVVTVDSGGPTTATLCHGDTVQLVGTAEQHAWVVDTYQGRLWDLSSQDQALEWAREMTERAVRRDRHARLWRTRLARWTFR